MINVLSILSHKRLHVSDILKFIYWNRLLLSFSCHRCDTKYFDTLNKCVEELDLIECSEYAW